MKADSEETIEIDWSLATWEGSRRAQLERWSELPVENMVAALEEMDELNSMLHSSDEKPDPASAISRIDELVAAQSSLQTMASVPSYPDDYLRSLNANALIELMTRDEDRVPRNVIEICAARADEIEPILRAMLDDSRFWREEDIPEGAYWLVLHAIAILGSIPSAAAAHTLFGYFERLAEVDDLTWSDYCAGHWGAWMANKPQAAIVPFREFAEQTAHGADWRDSAIQAVLYRAHDDGPEALEPALDWLAETIRNSHAPAGDRVLWAAWLLDFPRTRHRALIEERFQACSIAEQIYGRQEIEQAFLRDSDDPDWECLPSFWDFYDPERIAERQRLEDEDGDDWLVEDLEDNLDYERPYVREIPKIGRNDPCHCGSGKKYKKCHLTSDEA